jgi:cold shock CspA family protein
METGTVKVYFADKGCGFIGRGGTTDLFVHSSGIINGEVLAEGDEVEFKIGVDRNNRPAAVNVRKVEG